jgi:hypothetical protein
MRVLANIVALLIFGLYMEQEQSIPPVLSAPKLSSAASLTNTVDQQLTFNSFSAPGGVPDQPSSPGNFTNLFFFPINPSSTKRKLYAFAIAQNGGTGTGLLRFLYQGKEVLRYPFIFGFLDNDNIDTFSGSLVPSIQLQTQGLNTDTIHASNWTANSAPDCITLVSTQNMGNDPNGTALLRCCVYPTYLTIVADTVSVELVKAKALHQLQVWVGVFSAPQ